MIDSQGSARAVQISSRSFAGSRMGRPLPRVKSTCGCFEAEVVEVGSAGRFWGYRGLRPVLAVREVTPDHGIQLGRILRRWYKAKGLTKRVRRQRVDQHTGRITTVRKKLFAANRGFATVNEAPAMVPARPLPRSSQQWPEGRPRSSTKTGRARIGSTSSRRDWTLRSCISRRRCVSASPSMTRRSPSCIAAPSTTRWTGFDHGRSVSNATVCPGSAPSSTVRSWASSTLAGMAALTRSSSTPSSTRTTSDEESAPPSCRRSPPK